MSDDDIGRALWNTAGIIRKVFPFSSRREAEPDENHSVFGTDVMITDTWGLHTSVWTLGRPNFKHAITFLIMFSLQLLPCCHVASLHLQPLVAQLNRSETSSWAFCFSNIWIADELLCEGSWRVENMETFLAAARFLLKTTLDQLLPGFSGAKNNFSPAAFETVMRKRT